MNTNICGQHRLAIIYCFSSLVSCLEQRRHAGDVGASRYTAEWMGFVSALLCTAPGSPISSKATVVPFHSRFSSPLFLLRRLRLSDGYSDGFLVEGIKAQLHHGWPPPLAAYLLYIYHDYQQVVILTGPCTGHLQINGHSWVASLLWLSSPRPSSPWSFELSSHVAQAWKCGFWSSSLRPPLLKWALDRQMSPLGHIHDWTNVSCSFCMGPQSRPFKIPDKEKQKNKANVMRVQFLFLIDCTYRCDSCSLHALFIGCGQQVPLRILLTPQGNIS